MTSSSNDRKMLHDLISDAYRRAPWGTDVFEYVADAILTKFLPGYTERVKAEAWREGHAQALHNVAWPKERQGNPYDRRES